MVLPFFMQKMDKKINSYPFIKSRILSSLQNHLYSNALCKILFVNVFMVDSDDCF